MPIPKIKQFIVTYIEDNKECSCTCKGFAELYRKLEQLQWKVLNAVDISLLIIKEA